MNTQLTSIQEAYEQILSEGTVSKFKNGDKVGIGQYSHDGQYFPHDTGTITKLNKLGQHEVTHDNRKSSDDNATPFVSLFNHAGYSKQPNNPGMIIPIEQHNANIADQMDNHERSNDLNTVMTHLAGKRTQNGKFSKLEKSQTEHLKALLDKHTEA